MTSRLIQCRLIRSRELAVDVRKGSRFSRKLFHVSPVTIIQRHCCALCAGCLELGGACSGVDVNRRIVPLCFGIEARFIRPDAVDLLNADQAYAAVAGLVADVGDSLVLGRGMTEQGLLNGILIM